MHFKAILFDLDGTLNNSGPGIIESVLYAYRHLCIQEPPEDRLSLFVGPPLSESFPRFGVPENRVEEAVLLFRYHYSVEKACRNCQVYAGVPQLLDQLRHSGYSLYVATSKLESAALEVMQYIGLADYFDAIAGSNKTRNTKEEVLHYLIHKEHLENAVMIGDTVYDVTGAKKEGLPCIGVSWGYGSVDEMKKAGVECIVHSPQELLQVLQK